MFLNCHTGFSFKYGSLSIDELFEEAKRCGVHKLALTDIHNTSAYIDLMRICRERASEHALSFIPGIEFRQEDELLYIGLARNNRGFEALNRYLSAANATNRPLRRKAPHLSDVYFIYPLSNRPEHLAEHEFTGIRSRDLSRLITARHQVDTRKCVILHPVTFKDRTSYNVHRLLRAIDKNTLLSKQDPASLAGKEEVMLPVQQIKEHFKLYPEVIRNTEMVLENCQVSFDPEESKNIRHIYGSKKEDYNFLKTRAREGYQLKYADHTDAVTEERFERELDIISRRNFESYYLVTYDMIQFARRQGFAHVGRGSGANSMVSYCLGITDVDPIELDLYFERFLNPSRSSPPDFDIDFSWKDRDHVYRYLFEKYENHKNTRGHVALLGTHITFKAKSAARELGKVFGLPKEEIDKLARGIYTADDPNVRLILQYADRMHGLPSHLSIHAGGVLITEEPLSAYTATDLPPKGFPTAHLEMHSAEDMGIHKFDVLSQRGLGHIKDAVQLIKANRGEEVDATDFRKFKTDPHIRELLSSGRTTGCFYVESPAMRMLLGKLQCSKYETLVAASSIIRPGVAMSGMMRTYIERHHMKLQGIPIQSIHPKMDELMEDTHGVMVYQEDVIKVAHHFANISLEDADILRRGMSGKFRSRMEFQRLEDTFFRNCKELGYEDRVSERVWFEISSFAGYSFSKGHSASYAVESYQSLFLKAYYPLEFMVGVINNFGGFYKTEFYFQEARKNGAVLRPPCVNHSDQLTGISGITIYTGFIHLKSLEKQIGELIPKERKARGPFTDLDNFIRRIPAGPEQVRILIRAGAFAFTGKAKKTLLWEAQLYFGGKKINRSTGELFQVACAEYELPAFADDPLEDAFDQLELLGFPLCNPFLLLDEGQNQEAIRPETHIMAGKLINNLGRKINLTGYLVTTKDTATGKGLPMQFGTFLDAKGDVFDTVHFPGEAKRFPFTGRGFYVVYGKVVEDHGYPMLEVSFMKKIPMRPVRVYGKQLQHGIKTEVKKVS